VIVKVRGVRVQSDLSGWVIRGFSGSSGWNHSGVTVLDDGVGLDHGDRETETELELGGKPAKQ